MRRCFNRRRSFKPCFEALEDRRVLSGLPFDDSGLAPAGLQALCALPNLPVFNVHDYGATGNGVSDDTLAIRAAISAAKTSGGGIIYLPTGTYAVDPQASDPKAWGPIFSITSSNIVFIGDGASNTHLVGYVEGLKDPATNWYVTGDPYQKIGRGNMFEVDPSANVTGIQFRSLDINGQAGYTGNFTVGGNIVTGDGWDTYDKAICLGFGTHRVDNTLIFNCNIRNWRGEEIYAGGSINGAISVVNCTLTGTNADAISCSAAVLLSHSTIGGTSAGDDVYNGLEDYCFPTQSTTVDHSTIICSSNPAAPRGYGLSFEGEVGGSALTVTNSVFANNSSDILLQDTAHNILIDSNTFTNSLIGGVITSILNLYPGVTSGFSDATISNNTFSGNWQAASLCALGNYGPNPTRNFPNLVISGNTVTKGQLLGGAFGGTLGSWTGFVVENNTLKPGTRDIDPGSQGSNIGLWSGTIRPAAGTNAFYNSGVLNNGGSGPTATIRILSDATVLAANSAGSNPIAAEIDPTVLAGFPVGFTTTVYASGATNWVLPTNSAWNTWVSDIPVTVGSAGVTIRVNSQGLFELVNQVTTSTTVSSSDSSSIFGQSVTFTAAVSASTPGAGTPTGTVTFVDGSITLGTATLDSTGKATFTTSVLSVGDHAISASYGGDTNFPASSSGEITQSVLPATTIPVTGLWNYNGSGRFDDGAKWYLGVPNGTGNTAVFGGGATIPVNVPAVSATIDGAVDAGTLLFNSATTSYTLAADGVSGHGLVLNDNGVGAAVVVTAGNHTISADLTLADPGGTMFAMAQGSALTLSGAVTVSDTSPTVTLNVSGTLGIASPPTLPANTAIFVTGGKLIFNATSGTSHVGSGVTVTIASAATLELAGSVAVLSAGSSRANILNNSTASGVVVSGINQGVGNIDGIGNILVIAGSDLTANHIIQTALIIGGTAGSPAAVTIAASDASGNPMIASAASTLSEPGSTGIGSANSLTSSGAFGASAVSSGNLSSVVSGGSAAASQSGLSSIAAAANETAAKTVPYSPNAVGLSSVPRSEPIRAAVAAGASLGDSVPPASPSLRASEPQAPTPPVVPESPLLRSHNLVFESLGEAGFQTADPVLTTAAISQLQFLRSGAPGVVQLARGPSGSGPSALQADRFALSPVGKLMATPSAGSVAAASALDAQLHDESVAEFDREAPLVLTALVLRYSRQGPS